MAKKVLPPNWNVGDRVGLRYYPDIRARIIELRGPLGPNGEQIYRIRYKLSSRPSISEVREDQLIPLPAKKKAKSTPSS